TARLDTAAAEQQGQAEVVETGEEPRHYGILSAAVEVIGAVQDTLVNLLVGHAVKEFGHDAQGIAVTAQGNNGQAKALQFEIHPHAEATAIHFGFHHQVHDLDGAGIPSVNANSGGFDTDKSQYLAVLAENPDVVGCQRVCVL